MRISFVFRSVAIALALAFANATGAYASPSDDVKATFGRFISAQNAHDVKALSDVLWDQPNFLWITGGTTIFGRDAALQRFATLYAGTWSLPPVTSDLRVTMLSPDAAQIFAPIDFTIGAAGATPAVTRFYMNQSLIKTPRGWVVASILPIVAAPAPKPSASPG